LDAALAYTKSAPMTLLQQHDSYVASEDLILATPAKGTHRVLTTNAFQNLTSISSALHPAYLSSRNIIASVGALHNASHPNKTAFLETPYIRFIDTKLPGPEWEVDYARVVQARPKDKDADWLWTKMYGEFAGRRYDVCGLGLEVWRE
jgi:hypothetical protein